MALSVNRKWIAALPVLVIFLSLLQILPFLLPDIGDNLTESYEPVKTLRFIYTHGAAVHKWGPFPSLIFAPVYAVMLLISKLGHHLTNLSKQYPYGFDDPVIQMGHMLLAARITVLIVGLLSIYYLCRSLQRALRDDFAPPIALLLCLTTSLVFLEPLADTKPDGMMVSLLICALANYVSIVLEGITAGSAIRLAFFYVASLSCKELTSTTMMLPYLGLAVAALTTWRSNPTEGKRPVRLLLLSAISIPVFYLLINVIYAPHAWRERIAFVFGPLKDPAAWAEPGQTKLTYLRDTGIAIFASLGWGGILMLLVALAGSVRYPSWKLLLLWLPFLGHVVCTTLLGGYMPTYFMLPLGPALALPAAFVLAQMLKPLYLQSGTSRRLIVATAVLSLCCVYLSISAMTIFRDTHGIELMSRAMIEQVPPGATVDPIRVWSTSRSGITPGPDGRQVDHRPLFAIMQVPEQNRPTYALISTDTEAWAKEIKDRPARAALLLADTNFDYSSFQNFEALGYTRTAVTKAALPAWVAPALIADSQAYTLEGVDVYRLKSAPTASQPHNVTATLP